MAPIAFLRRARKRPPARRPTAPKLGPLRSLWEGLCDQSNGPRSLRFSGLIDCSLSLFLLLLIVFLLFRRRTLWLSARAPNRASADRYVIQRLDQPESGSIFLLSDNGLCVIRFLERERAYQQNLYDENDN
jgi:hypothetical protein